MIKNTLVIGDCHFGTKTNSTQWLEQMTTFFQTQIIKSIEEYKFDKVIFLGDLFDIRYSTNTLVGVKVKDIIRNMVKEFPYVKFCFLSGNHDYYSPRKEDMHYNVYEMVFGNEFIKMYNNVDFYTESPFLDEDGDLFLPWFFTEDKELFAETLEHYNHENINRVFCHSDLSCWDLDMIKQMNRKPVYSGHIHTPWIDEEHNLYNLGAALPLNFNDVNDNRYIYWLEGNEIKEKIKNITTPKFLRYFNDKIFELNEPFQNCFVQLYIDKKYINKAEYIERIKELKVSNPSIPIRVVTIDEETMDLNNIGIDMNQDIKKYITSNIPENLYDKYEIIKSKVEGKEK